ncbi:hypothetical protein D3C80_1870490 [compost metagenome]
MPVTILETVRRIVGVNLEQGLLANPASFEGLDLPLPRWPGMQQKLQRMQLLKHRSIVVRHFDELTGFKCPLRVFQHPSPA